jgi:hypothetical protein
VLLMTSASFSLRTMASAQFCMSEFHCYCFKYSREKHHLLHVYTVLSLTKTCVVITGMEVLLEMLTSFTNAKQQCDGALALCTLAKKATALSPIDVAPLPPTPQVCDLVSFHISFSSFPF